MVIDVNPMPIAAIILVGKKLDYNALSNSDNIF